jgi:CRP-like cAMP-binding protein
MPLFSTPPLKQLPVKLRQILSARTEMEAKQGTLNGGFASGSPSRRNKKLLRSPNRQIALDTLAVSTRSRPPSAAAKRRSRPTSAANYHKKSAEVPESTEKSQQLSRHDTAPERIVQEAKKKTKAKDTFIVGGTAGGTATSTANVALLQRRGSAPVLSGTGNGNTGLQIIIDAGRRSNLIRSPLARRRSSVALDGASPTGSDRKAKSKKRREQQRRDERRRINDKLRHVLGSMLNRKLSQGWETWRAHVQAHRHRDLESSAMSVLEHIQPGKRNPNEIKTVMEWICQIKLPCLRPLIEGHRVGGSNIEVDAKDDVEGSGGSSNLLAKMCKSCHLRKYNQGEILFWQTEFGDHYYIVVQGAVGIYAKQERGAAAKLAQHTEDLVKGGHVATNWSIPSKKKLLGRYICDYEPGTGFGELALVSWDRERKATAMAAEDDTYVLLVDRVAYNKCLWHLHQADQNLDERVTWLQSIDHFKLWEEHRLAQFAYELKESVFHRGDLVITEGSVVDSLVLLRSGVCQGFLERRGEGTRNEVPLALYEPGTFLGQTDLAVSSSRQRAHQMHVRSLSSSEVKVYYIPRESYIKFVLKITDATTSQLKRRLIDLAKARDRQIELAIRCSKTTEKISRDMSPLRPTKVSVFH